MPANSLIVDVPAALLHVNDVIVADPDHPDTEVHWLVTAREDEAGVRVIEYVTEDDTQGRHGFPDRLQWVKVAAGQRGAAA